MLFSKFDFKTINLYLHLRKYRERTMKEQRRIYCFDRRWPVFIISKAYLYGKIYTYTYVWVYSLVLMRIHIITRFHVRTCIGCTELRAPHSNVSPTSLNSRPSRNVAHAVECRHSTHIQWLLMHKLAFCSGFLYSSTVMKWVIFQGCRNAILSTFKQNSTVLWQLELQQKQEKPH